MKAIKNILKVCEKKPETKWSNYEQVENLMETLIGGPNSCMLKNTGMICG